VIVLSLLEPASWARVEPLLAAAGHRVLEAPTSDLTPSFEPDVVLFARGAHAPAAATQALRARFPLAWLVQVVESAPDRLSHEPDDVWVLESAELSQRIRVADRCTRCLQERRRQRTLFELAPVGIFRSDLGTLSYANEALARLLDCDVGALTGAPLQSLFADPAEHQALLAELETSHHVRAFQVTVTTRRSRHRRVTLSASRDGDSIVGVTLDMTRVKRAEAELRASEELIERLLDVVPGGVVFVGLDGSVGMGNAEAQRILGLSYDELAKRYVSDFEPETIHEDGSAVSAAEYPVSAALSTGQEQPPMVIGVRRPTGETSWAVFKAVGVSDPETHEPTGAVVTMLDITQRKQAEQDIVRSESRYRELVERSPDPMAIIVEGHVAFANRAALTLVKAGAEGEVVGKSVFSLFSPSRRDSLVEHAQALLSGANVAAFEEVLLRLDGSEAWVELAATAVTYEGKPAIFVAPRDITARKSAEHKLRRYEAAMQHTQKLESLGILAGGIAHDFNNLLVAIVGNADLARLRLADDSPALECLDRIQAAAQRATDLTNQMLAYSGKSRFVVMPIDLSALVREMSDLLGSVISKQARLHRDLAADLPSVEADPAQLAQVVMNLITNASDALNGEPGDVFISTRLVDVDRGFLQQTYLDEGLPEGRYVCLEVRDNGCGMDEETRTKIFDPFYTTKATGRGLGLAATLGIVRGHRGALRIDTVPGSGTLFRIFFPGSKSPSSVPRRATTQPPRVHVGACVLIAGDESLMLEVTREQLARVGFRVLTADTDQKALDLLKRPEAKVDVVLLDVTLAAPSGPRLLATIAERYPNLRLVLSSSYTEQEARERLADALPLARVSSFLQKPYTEASLKRALTDALNEPA